MPGKEGDETGVVGEFSLLEEGIVGVLSGAEGVFTGYVAGVVGVLTGVVATGVLSEEIGELRGVEGVVTGEVAGVVGVLTTTVLFTGGLAGTYGIEVGAVPIGTDGVTMGDVCTGELTGGLTGAVPVGMEGDGTVTGVVGTD